MRVLFVCTMNLDRSPTAQSLLAGRAGVEVRSAGTHPEAQVPVTSTLIAWADVIAVMEAAHERALRSRFSETLAGKSIVNLDVRDVYSRGEHTLREVLEERIARHLTPLLDR
jgi:predicted protein tyrosine phosphatase